jgi:hypothetical protein
MAPRVALISLSLALTACAGPARGTNCGIVGIAGPSLLLEEFTKPGRTLSELPDRMPERLVVRLAAGPAYPAIVGKTDSSWVIGIDAPVAGPLRAGFGVLVVDPSLGVQGVLLYEGSPIPGAPILGSVNAGTQNLPFHALRANIAAFQDVSCRLFPDSLAR